ncbi:MAG: glycosyltransferase family 39 protein [Elusimicrobia bacterium]|nr:glycosyltransferase family 39 protein [Elusimicrobiota bacterium]
MARKKAAGVPDQRPAPPTRGQWAGAVLLALIFAARLLHGAALKAPAYDEALYLVYGHSLWQTGDFRLSIDKPPLVPWVAGAPARPLGASFDAEDEDWRKADLWLRADSPWNGLQDHRWRFFLKDLHRNQVSSRRLLFAGRAALILMNAAAVLGAFALASRLFGARAGLWLAFFLSVSPNLLAYAGLVGEDAPVALFALLSVLAFLWTLEAPSPGRGAALGAATAAALLSKHSALTLGPSFIAVLALGLFSGSVPRDRDSLRRLGLAYAAGAAAAAALFLAAYLGTDLRFYFLSVKNTLAYQTRGQAAYLFGAVSNTGFRHYYLACLLLKLSPALLILPAVWLARRGWTRREAFRTAAILIPAVVLTAIASANKIQIGLRYVLPAVALLAVPAALAAERRPWLGAVFGLWTALASFGRHPDYLAYFNPLAGREGWRRLSDANVDWGQDLRGLEDYVRTSGADEVILSYYGATLVSAVRFPFQDLWSFGVWGEKTHLGAPEPKKELLAVSATNRVGLYLRRILGPEPFAWLDGRTPVAVLGGSIFVYDVTSDADAHARLAKLYAAAGAEAHARREAARAMRIDPSGAALAAVFGRPRP